MTTFAVVRQITAFVVVVAVFGFVVNTLMSSPASLADTATQGSWIRDVRPQEPVLEVPAKVGEVDLGDWNFTAKKPPKGSGK